MTLIFELHSGFTLSQTSLQFVWNKSVIDWRWNLPRETERGRTALGANAAADAKLATKTAVRNISS